MTKRVLRDGVPHKVFNLFEHPSLLESGKQRQAINKPRGHKIQSKFYVRDVMSLFSSDVFSKTEIIEIIIPVTSFLCSI